MWRSVPTESGSPRRAEDGTVKVWYVDVGREVLTLGRHDSFVKVVAFSPDGKQIATASGNGRVNLWSAGIKGSD